MDQESGRVPDAQNPVRQRVQSLNFGKCTARKEIIDGVYSANEERFNRTHGSMMSQMTNASVKMDKYSSRANRSVGGNQFEAGITGLFYDVPDSYKSQVDQAFSFSAQPAWPSTQKKREYGHYKLTRDQLRAINFKNLQSKLKSVKPKTGKALRNHINKEDDYFFKLFIGARKDEENSD